MEKRKRLGLILVLVFVVVTGILFSADFAAGPDRSVPETSSERPDQEGLPARDGRAGAVDDPDNAHEQERESEAQSPETDRAGSGTQESESSGMSEDEKIYVYVCGAVKHPDVYCLSSGARVYEALEKAGGVTRDAQPQLMNLAAALSDGERIYVPKEGEEDPALSAEGSLPGSPASAGAALAVQDDGSALVDINRASKEQLMTLPGIGSSRAGDILAYREANGPFVSTSDLMKVPGIKEGVYAKLKDRITVQ